MLTELIDVCKDGRRGFWQAAVQLDNKYFREWFRKEAFQRNAFELDLKETALKLGVSPPKRESFGGKLHRSWMNFRHQLNPHQDKVVLLECQRGEEHALKVYQDVFENNLLPEIQPILEKQFVTMIEMRDRLRTITSQNEMEGASGSMLRLL